MNNIVALAEHRKPTLSELHERYDGPVPKQHLEARLPDDVFRHGIRVNSGLADQFDRAAEMATNDEDRERAQRNAAWHREEIERLRRDWCMQIAG